MFRGDILKTLIAETKCSLRDISEATEISVGSLESYIAENGSKKGTQPSLEIIEKLADFFCVPVDVLLGRCTLKQQAVIISDFSKNFIQLRHSSYEKYLLSKKGARRSDFPASGREKFEAPYPYNLFDEINGEPIDWIIREKNLETLDWALNSLQERQKEYILLYFKEQLTLNEIAVMYGLSRERIRQVISKGLKNLRHPSLKNQILKGLHSIEEIDEYAESKTKELDEREEKLNEREKTLDEKETAVEMKVKELVKAGCSRGEIFKNVSRKGYAEISEMPIGDADLSVRCFNCLIRSGLNTIGEVTDFLENNTEQFIKIRNLGKKSYFELLDKLDYLYETTRFNSIYKGAINK